MERIALREAIGKLPEREALVINLRYFHGLTQERVARVLQVSQVQVSRIEKKALGAFAGDDVNQGREAVDALKLE